MSELCEAAINTIEELDTGPLTQAMAPVIREILVDYLKERPEDDGTPVDMAWLDRCKSRRVGPGEYEFLDQDSGTGIRIVLGKRMTVSISDHDGNYCRLHGLYGDLTRGDLRRLAKVLRIDLGERR